MMTIKMVREKAPVRRNERATFFTSPFNVIDISIDYTHPRNRDASAVF